MPLRACATSYLPDHLIGEVLSKRWIDNAIPFLALVITVGTLSSIIPDFLTMSSLSDMARQFAEFGLIVAGLVHRDDVGRHRPIGRLRLFRCRAFLADRHQCL